MGYKCGRKTEGDIENPLVLEEAFISFMNIHGDLGGIYIYIHTCIIYTYMYKLYIYIYTYAIWMDLVMTVYPSLFVSNIDECINKQ